MLPIRHALLCLPEPVQQKKHTTVLKKFGGLSPLTRTVLSLEKIGVEQFFILVEHQAVLQKYIRRHSQLRRMNIRLIQPVQLHETIQREKILRASDWIITFVHHIFSIKVYHKFTQHLDRVIPAYTTTEKGNFRGMLYVPAKQFKSLLQDLSDFSVKSIKKWFVQRTDYTIDIGHYFSAILTDKDSYKIAKKTMLNSLVKPTDGWVSKHINRKISTRISWILANWNITPNQVTTFVFLITTLGAYWVASGQYLWIALGGIVFQVASILDGCDGEIARLTHQSTRWGAWYDTLTDNFRYIMFFAALGIGSYQQTGFSYYPFAITFFVIFAMVGVIRMAIYVWNAGGALNNLGVTEKINQNAAKKVTIWNRIWLRIQGIEKQDVSALIAATLCVLGLQYVMFWLVTAVISVWVYTIVKNLQKVN